MEKLPLWGVSIGLALGLRVVQRLIQHPLLMAVYCLMIPAGFYAVMMTMGWTVEDARSHGWLPELAEAVDLQLGHPLPFVRLWSYIQWDRIDWSVLIKTIPTMFALVLFALLQLSINVRAHGHIR